MPFLTEQEQLVNSLASSSALQQAAGQDESTLIKMLQIEWTAEKALKRRTSFPGVCPTVSSPRQV
jgi:hypothetical protein